MQTYEIQASLENGEIATGAWLFSGSPRAAEALSTTALDWIGVDTEHAPTSPEQTEAIIRAIEPNAAPVVRVPSVAAATSGAAKHALDMGAAGVIVPRVETVTDVKQVIDACNVPPRGSRGVAGTTRANAYGNDFEDHWAVANDSTFLAVQIESETGVENADEIFAVPGVDIGFIGENDLAASLGVLGQKDHPTVKAAVDDVREAAIDNDIVPGIAGRSPDQLAERANSGFQFFLLGSDITFVQTFVDDFLDGS